MLTFLFVDDQLFQSLLDAVAQRGGKRTFPTQVIFINEGDAIDLFYIVLSGRLKVYASFDDGCEVVLVEHGFGEYFGELSLDGVKRSVSVKALEPIICCIVQGVELRQFLVEHFDFALHITLKFIRMVRCFIEQVKSLALQDVYGCMVCLLTEMSDFVGDERVVRYKMMQQDIVDCVGLSREMVNRVMKELTAGGYVLLRDGRYVIYCKLLVVWQKMVVARFVVCERDFDCGCELLAHRSLYFRCAERDDPRVWVGADVMYWLSLDGIRV